MGDRSSNYMYDVSPGCYCRICGERSCEVGSSEYCSLPCRRIGELEGRVIRLEEEAFPLVREAPNERKY